jgi:hypothetical protein
MTGPHPLPDGWHWAVCPWCRSTYAIPPVVAILPTCRGCFRALPVPMVQAQMMGVGG